MKLKIGTVVIVLGCLSLISCSGLTQATDDSKGDDKCITAFSIANASSTETIDEANHTISIRVINGANITSLTPTITYTGASVSPPSGVAQDFSSAVTYTVTAEDGSTQKYAVSVSYYIKKIGYSQFTTNGDWRTAQTASIKDAIAGQGTELVFKDAGSSQETQIADIRSLIEEGVDALILVLKTDTGWDEVLSEAKTAGIPVIFVDRGATTDEGNYATYIQSDYANEGAQVARVLGEKLSSGEVVELEGTEEILSTKERKEAFDAALAANYPGLTIIDSHSCDYTSSVAEEYLNTNYFASHPNIRAIFAHNDDMALGAIRAIKKAGMTPGTDIIVVSIDGMRSALQAVLGGELYYTFECSPLLGSLAIEACNKAAAGVALDKAYDGPTERGFFQSDLTQEIIDARPY